MVQDLRKVEKCGQSAKLITECRGVSGGLETRGNGERTK